MRERETNLYFLWRRDPHQKNPQKEQSFSPKVLAKEQCFFFTFFLLSLLQKNDTFETKVHFLTQSRERSVDDTHYLLRVVYILVFQYE